MAFRDQSDEALVHRVRSGEREVFGVLVDRYKRGIANFIGATVRNSSETADLSQETFLRAYAHLNTFNPQLGKFSTWVYQIARNVIRTYLAKSQRAPQLQELPQEHSLETVFADLPRKPIRQAACCVEKPSANCARRSPSCRNERETYWRFVISTTWSIKRSRARWVCRWVT